MKIFAMDIINNGWVTNTDVGNITSIPLTLDRLISVNMNNYFILDQNETNILDIQERGVHEVVPIPHRRTGIRRWYLKNNGHYRGISNIGLNIPENMFVTIHPTDLVSRNGIQIPSLMFESGETIQEISFAIFNGGAYITPGATVGKIVFHNN
jgi:deoxycytidine triphosphate deaminase